MSEFASSEIKKNVVDETTSLALVSGFIARYHEALRHVLKTQERLASLDAPGTSFFSGYAQKVQQVQSALTAEIPVAISVEPSNMAASVHMIKVDPESGKEITGSSIQIGLVGGLAGEGHPNESFTEEDLSLAVDRVRAQEQAGLYYGLPGGSVFM